MKMRPLAAVALAGLLSAAIVSCVDEGEGSDFDLDGVPDQIEDPNDNFLFDAGESDFNGADTDGEGVCDGLPERELGCVRCEDCDNDGKFEPCLNETDPLNDDTDNDGASDRDDPAPIDRFAVDCAAGGELAYGASLPPGKPFPVTPTPSPFPTLTPPPGVTPPPAGATPTLPPIAQTAIVQATQTAAAQPTPTPGP